MGADRGDIGVIWEKARRGSGGWKVVLYQRHTKAFGNFKNNEIYADLLT
jgi:hypothetical protein